MKKIISTLGVVAIVASGVNASDINLGDSAGLKTGKAVEKLLDSLNTMPRITVGAGAGFLNNNVVKVVNAKVFDKVADTTVSTFISYADDNQMQTEFSAYTDSYPLSKYVYSKNYLTVGAEFANREAVNSKVSDSKTVNYYAKSGLYTEIGNDNFKVSLNPYIKFGTESGGVGIDLKLPVQNYKNLALNLNAESKIWNTSAQENGTYKSTTHTVQCFVSYSF